MYPLENVIPGCDAPIVLDLDRRSVPRCRRDVVPARRGCVPVAIISHEHAVSPFIFCSRLPLEIRNRASSSSTRSSPFTAATRSDFGSRLQISRAMPALMSRMGLSGLAMFHLNQWCHGKQFSELSRLSALLGRPLILVGRMARLAVTLRSSVVRPVAFRAQRTVLLQASLPPPETCFRTRRHLRTFAATSPATADHPA